MADTLAEVAGPEETFSIVIVREELRLLAELRQQIEDFNEEHDVDPFNVEEDTDEFAVDYHEKNTRLADLTVLLGDEVEVPPEVVEELDRSALSLRSRLAYRVWEEHVYGWELRFNDVLGVDPYRAKDDRDMRSKVPHPPKVFLITDDAEVYRVCSVKRDRTDLVWVLPDDHYQFDHLTPDTEAEDGVQIPLFDGMGLAAGELITGDELAALSALQASE